VREGGYRVAGHLGAIVVRGVSGEAG
jgi:hypothetical protein